MHHTWKPSLVDWERNPNGSYWMNVIDRYHRSKGWKGVGYHFVIMPNGLIFVGRGLNEVGAHTVGQNERMIGVCLLGNFDDEVIEEPQWISMKYLLSFLLYRFDLKPHNIFFHRQFANKTCPGRRLVLSDIRVVIEKTLPDAIKRYEEILKEGQG